MRTLVIALALTSASAMYAQAPQTPQTACSTNTSSSLPDSAGCLPATYTPADGGAPRPVLLDVTFLNTQGGGVPVPHTAVKIRELQIGAFGSYTQPDYGASVNTDVGVYVVWTANHLGVEADSADTVVNRGGIREKYAVIGPRFQQRMKFATVYLKAQAGAGEFSGDPANIYSNKVVGAVEQYGAGVEMNAGHHLKVRLADYSYQVWPEFSPHNLSPVHISSGLAMRF